MTRVRKVIGIITSLILYFCVLIGSLGVVLFFAVQSSSFQTYIGQKAANWLSDELKTKVAIKKIDFNFFSTLTLNGVYIQDLNKDTLVYLSELNCNIKLINLTKNKLYLDKLELKNGTIKAITYRNDTLPNYQFLVDYFSNPNDTSKSEPFDVKYGKIIFSNVNAIYHNQNDTIKTKAVNFSNIRLKKLSGTIEQLKVQKDSVFIDLHDFTFFESSGFTLTKLNTDLCGLFISKDSMYFFKWSLPHENKKME